MSKSLIDFIWEQESYDGIVELPVSKTYKDESGEAVPVVLQIRRPGSVETLAFAEAATDGGTPTGSIAALAATLLIEPDLSDPRMMAKFSANTPLEALSRWLSAKDLAELVSCVAKLVAEANAAILQEQADAKNS